MADQVAGTVRVLDLPDGRLAGELTGRHLAEHAGFLALPGGRWAFADDLAGEVVVLDPYGPDHGRPLVAATAPVAVPAEHLAADPSGRLLAVSTGLGRDEAAWSDLLTAVDLAAPGGPRAVRVRTRTGEPGVTVLGPPDDALVVLRHREPGALAAYRHAELLAAAPGCPAVGAAYGLPLPDPDGHGDAQDPCTGRVFAATGSGVHRARRAGEGLVAEEPLAWAGPGRGYYLRLDPGRRALWSCVRGGPADPGRWPEWSNDAWCHALDTGRTERVPLGPGLVFRLALTDRHAAFARVHPDGDELILLTPGPAGVRTVARRPLPPMAGAPRPGSTPWDGVQRRAIAGSPGAGFTAVSRGGHGEIHLFDGTEPVATLTVPTPLDDGGHLALTAPDDGAEGDPVGR
ncbi:hypothetical protein NX801_07085 [Streptomyces sp. LP05-1]|uniref:Uncharacterized protein n=1 Tax=Streptomyces pyxinae TaxID=2970734 RepID=A0ABT2CDC7_9ACTN|nr:hypothetical protein [Streptomyces sp. LP05-1]MCS0635426.1 hypothetical protein [Streptomyces sp. LP05-1]